MEQRNDKREEKNKTISRRNFLKASGTAGLVVGAVAANGLSNPGQVLAGEDTGRPIVDFTINEVEKPPYMSYPYEGAEKLERFRGELTATYNKDLMEERFNGNRYIVPMYNTIMSQLKSEEPIRGYSLIENALAGGAWIGDTIEADVLYSWEPLGVADIWKFDEIDKWNGTPEENNKIIKRAAKLYGAGQTGITEVNEQWFYSKDENGLPIIFSDEHDKPIKTEEAKYIPKSMKTVIVIAIPMNEECMKYVPSTLSEAAVAVGYSKMAEIASKMAEFIRGLGYNAIPMGNDTGLSIPMAIDAGLGELGRNGMLINPLYGNWLRLIKVLTDLPANYDKPIEFGAAQFCRTCMKCADTCPSKSISFDNDTSTETYCGSNNPGMKKWYVNVWNCLEFWSQNGSSCATCIAVCPYNKPQTWIHEVVKGVSAYTTIFNGTFKQLDDVLGYGKTLDDSNPKEWWGI